MKRLLSLINKPLPAWLTLFLLCAAVGGAALPVYTGEVNAQTQNVNHVPLQINAPNGTASNLTTWYNNSIIEAALDPSGNFVAKGTGNFGQSLQAAQIGHPSSTTCGDATPGAGIGYDLAYNLAIDASTNGVSLCGASIAFNSGNDTLIPLTLNTTIPLATTCPNNTFCQGTDVDMGVAPSGAHRYKCIATEDANLDSPFLPAGAFFSTSKWITNGGHVDVGVGIYNLSGSSITGAPYTYSIGIVCV